MFYVGSNMPGYLPEGDVQECEDFETAKQQLIGDLLFDADRNSDLCSEDPDVDPCPDGCACDLDNATQDVNHWSGPDSIIVGNIAYWIHEEI